MEEALFAEVAVEEGEDDEGDPDHPDQPQLLVGAHLVADGAGLHSGGPEICALKDPVGEVADDGVLLHPDDEVGTVDDPAHGPEKCWAEACLHTAARTTRRRLSQRAESCFL